MQHGRIVNVLKTSESFASRGDSDSWKKKKKNL